MLPDQVEQEQARQILAPMQYVTAADFAIITINSSGNTTGRARL